MINGTLPPRLVVLAPLDDADKDISGVTSNHIPIDYTNTEGPQTANYRWIGVLYRSRLGGLYRGRLGNIDHYRVYWAHWEQGEYDGGLKIYDCTRLGGAIVGGIPLCSDDDWVPPYWSRRRPDVIFYERIDEIDVDLVADTIRSTADDQLDELDELVRVSAVPALKCNPRGKYREVETEDLPAPSTLPTSKPNPNGKDRKVEKVALLMPHGPKQQVPMPPPATKPSQKRKNREDEPAAGSGEQRSPGRQKQSAPSSNSRDGHISISDQVLVPSFQIQKSRQCLKL